MFLQSVSDKGFDIFFFSDNVRPVSLPSNCKWVSYSFNEIKNLFDNKLQMSVSLNHPKKLCDFKPALGFLFKEYIENYRFWGSLDIDTCMGNFGNFFTRSIADSADVVSGIKEYLSGSFFLIRNNDYCNNLFRKSKDWQHVLTTQENMIFDECGGPFFKQLKAGKSFEEIKPPIESFTQVLFKESKKQLRLSFSDLIAEPKKKTTFVDRDKIIYRRQEYLLVHFIYYKTWYSFYTNKTIKIPFYINRLGFFQHYPAYIVVLLSKNFWTALYRKIMINLRKFGYRA